uniref:Conserved hypothetical plastid protein n=1 Tax=Bulboplastis apyrenoidosa TaxID=1070855 RepID=A0A1X9PVT5_9RHOD|nr:conserved hypothetical plastid protein [Bulboplastis apyrenoidosa]ARO90853.1 conserved hypothetical plastid protein [Bulboplastis apyrenoidosa]
MLSKFLMDLYDSLILYKMEHILKNYSNRYEITLNIAQKAKINLYDEINIKTSKKFKPIIQVVIDTKLPK